MKGTINAIVIDFVGGDIQIGLGDDNTVAAAGIAFDCSHTFAADVAAASAFDEASVEVLDEDLGNSFHIDLGSWMLMSLHFA